MTLERGAGPRPGDGSALRSSRRRRPCSVPAALAEQPVSQCRISFTTYNYDWVLSPCTRPLVPTPACSQSPFPSGLVTSSCSGPRLTMSTLSRQSAILSSATPAAFGSTRTVIPLDLKPGRKYPRVTATLRRGVTLRARVQGQDGKPIKSFMVLSRSYSRPASSTSSSSRGTC